MDSDLIQLVNKLQDTFANLGEQRAVVAWVARQAVWLIERVGGELDMPQLAVVSGNVPCYHPSLTMVVPAL
jgi:hypothetical protein